MYFIDFYRRGFSNGNFEGFIVYRRMKIRCKDRLEPIIFSGRFIV